MRIATSDTINRRMPSWVLAVALLGVPCLGGCDADSTSVPLDVSESQSEPVQGIEGTPLTSEQLHVDRGVVRLGAIVPHTFVLRVWDKGPVTVKKTSSSCCGGKGLIPDLTGRTLDAGSEVAVMLRLRAAMPGQELVSGTIECEGFKKPLQLSLTAVVVGAPIISPNPVMISVLDDAPPVFTLKAAVVRMAETSPLAFDQVHSNCKPFTVEQAGRSSRPFKVYSDQLDPLYSDELSLAFRLDSREEASFGDQHFKVLLAWGDGLPPSEVPVTIRQVPPIEPVVGQVFCGLLKSDTTWKGVVKFRQHGTAKQVVIKHVECTNPVVETALSDDRLTCAVSVTPSSGARGRETANLVVEYSESGVPNSNILISWVVVDNK